MTATPAFAASMTPPATVKLVWNTLTANQSGHRSIAGTFGLKVHSPGLSATASVTLYAKDDNGEVVDTLQLGPYSLGPDKNGVGYAFTYKFKPNKTYEISAIVSGTLISWRGDGVTETGRWALDSTPRTANPSSITMSPN